jgi:hypothetical protein
VTRSLHRLSDRLCSLIAVGKYFRRLPILFGIAHVRSAYHSLFQTQAVSAECIVAPGT